MLTRTLFWTTINASTASTGGGGSQLVSLSSICGYWKFDETSRTQLTDDAYSTRDGSIGTLIVCPSQGKISTSFNFKVGLGSYVSLPQDSSSQMGTSDFTMTAWVYPTQLDAGQWRGIFGGDFNGFVWGAYGTDLLGAKNNVAATPASGLTLTLNTWQFVAVTFDSTATTNNLTFYRNADSSTVNFNYDFDTAYTNYIGILVTLDSNHWIGNIDEVGIWKRKLTPTEISALYNAGNGLTYPFVG